jgi:GMP synthase (glutamine-hydrolysing)
MDRPLVLILDFGSQYTMLIARRIREESVYCEIHPCTMPLAEVRRRAPVAIILSGGPSSVFDEGAPTIDPALFDLGVPVLGICYGEQLTAHLGGGKVEPSELASTAPRRSPSSATRASSRASSRGEVHRRVDVPRRPGDRAAAGLRGARHLSAHSPFAAVGNAARRIYGVQFHPEVAHTPRGTDVLKSFLFDVAGCVPDWSAGAFAEEAIAQGASTVGDGHALCALSGGVDSSVAAILCQKALGDRLTCIFVDNGVLRKGERDQVERVFAGPSGSTCGSSTRASASSTPSRG